jgi:hypothetical protein
MDSAGKKEPVKKGRPSKLSRTESSRVRQVKQLFEEWLQDSSGYDDWPELKRALNENHSKFHS